MKTGYNSLRGYGFWILFTVFALPLSSASAHCDGLDGPVVSAARRALETGNVNLVLVWVQKDDETLIRGAFDSTVALRKQSPLAQQMADMYFFETLVRIHRAGEGAPFTGLKPAGRDLGPAIPAADKALESGDVDAVVTLLTHLVEQGVRERFQRALAEKSYDQNDVAAGREFIESYVKFLHYVEGVYQATQSNPEGHYHEQEVAAGHHDE